MPLTIQNKQYALWGGTLALFLIIADQITKIYFKDMVMSNGGTIEVLPFFNLVYVWNYGVSFGMMQSQTSLQVILLIAITSAITALFLVLLFRSETLFVALACGTVIGGALGNIIDRIVYGAVYDFLDFHLYDIHWPAFNVADAAVVIGIVMIVIDGVFFANKENEN